MIFGGPVKYHPVLVPVKGVEGDPGNAGGGRQTKSGHLPGPWNINNLPNELWSKLLKEGYIAEYIGEYCRGY